MKGLINDTIPGQKAAVFITQVVDQLLYKVDDQLIIWVVNELPILIIRLGNL